MNYNQNQLRSYISVSFNLLIFSYDLALIKKKNGTKSLKKQ